MAQLLEEIPSSNIGVVFDPVNLLTADNYAERQRILDDAFRLLSQRIVLVHQKDALLQEGELRAVMPGAGQFEIGPFLQRLGRTKPHIDISIENAGPDDIVQAIRYLKELAAQ